MNLGQPKHLKDLAKTGFNSTQKLGDGESVHRVLFGPGRVERIWFPVLAEKDGKLVPSRRALKRPAEGCSLDFIANLEIRIRQQMNQENPTSLFSAKNEFLYLALNVGDKEKVEVELWSYPYSVYKRLIDVEKERDTKNSALLRHGLIWMYDVIINKSVEKGKSRRYGTNYTVTVDSGYNKMASKVPVEWLDRPIDEILAEIDVIETGIFTAKQWEAVVSCDISLEEEIEPDTQETISQLLTKFPIYLDSKDQAGNYELPEREFLASELKNAGIPFVRDQKTQVAVREELPTQVVEVREEPKEIPQAVAQQEAKPEEPESRPLPPPPVDAAKGKTVQTAASILAKVRERRG